MEKSSPASFVISIDLTHCDFLSPIMPANRRAPALPSTLRVTAPTTS
jgi:hypothetical protein